MKMSVCVESYEHVKVYERNVRAFLIEYVICIHTNTIYERANVVHGFD